MPKGKEFQIVVGTKTSTDTRHRRQISVRWTQCTSWNAMFKSRVQIGRLCGVDGLVGDAGDLEFDG